MADESQGNGSPKDPQGSNAPDASQALNEEKVMELVNRAISGRLKDESKKQAKMFEEFGASFSSKFEQTLAEKLAGLAPKQAEPEGKKGKADDAKPTLDQDPEFQKLQKKLHEFEKRANQAEERERVNQAKARDLTLRQHLTDELAKHGMTPMQAKLAVGHLVDSAKLVSYGDNDAIVFRHDDDAIDLASGLKGWMKSDEGKHFLPPRGASGSGSNPGGGGANKGQQPQNVDPIMAALTAAVPEFLKG